MSAELILLVAIVAFGNAEICYRNMTTEEIIRSNGFPAEVHYVKMRDSCVIRVYRIPGKGPAVYLQHGLVDGANAWFLLRDGLGYALAEHGFDVWAAEYRPNVVKCFKVNVHSEAFWQYSIDILGKVYVPTVIKTILQKTGKKQIIYIGHSMGTTGFFICLSSYPELNEKITVMIGLGSVASLKYSTSPLLKLKYIEPLLTEYFNVKDGLPRVVSSVTHSVVSLTETVPLGFTEMLSRKLRVSMEILKKYIPSLLEKYLNDLFAKVKGLTASQYFVDAIVKLFVEDYLDGALVRRFCTATEKNRHFCIGLFEDIVGYEKGGIDKHVMTVLTDCKPEDASARELLQYAQQVVYAGRLFAFNFRNSALNMRAYNSTQPPEYDFKKNTVPTSFLSGKKDPLADLKDAKETFWNLGNPDKFYAIPGLSHISFVYSAHSSYHKLVFDILNKYKK